MDDQDLTTVNSPYAQPPPTPPW